MSSAIVGIKVEAWKDKPESYKAICLEEAGSPEEAGAYLLTLISQGDWKPGTVYMVCSGRKEMRSLLDGGSIKRLDTRVRSLTTLSKPEEGVKTEKDWDVLRKNYNHAYLYDWRSGTLSYQGKALPAGVLIYDMSCVLAGKVQR